MFINNMSNEFISKQDASEILGCSLSTINRRIKDGHIRAYHFPGYRRVFLKKSELFNSLKCFNDGE